eukprot:359210-Chlamydomonas_euryale.AAC.3
MRSATRPKWNMRPWARPTSPTSLRRGFGFNCCGNDGSNAPCSPHVPALSRRRAKLFRGPSAVAWATSPMARPGRVPTSLGPSRLPGNTAMSAAAGAIAGAVAAAAAAAAAVPAAKMHCARRDRQPTHRVPLSPFLAPPWPAAGWPPWTCASCPPGKTPRRPSRRRRFVRLHRCKRSPSSSCVARRCGLTARLACW